MDMNQMMRLLSMIAGGTGGQEKISNRRWNNPEGPTMARAAPGGAMAKGDAPTVSGGSKPTAPTMPMSRNGQDVIQQIRAQIQALQAQLIEAINRNRTDQAAILRQQIVALEEELQAAIANAGEKEEPLRMGTSSTGGNYAGKPRASRGRPENFGVGGASQIYRPWNR